MKPVAIPQPQGLKFTYWSSLVAELFAEYGILASTSDDAWQNWACGLLDIPSLSNIPSPMMFPDWQTWACRFRETF